MLTTNDSMLPLRFSARRLAALLAGLVLIAIGPALAEIDLHAAPNWARVLLLAGGLMAVYVLWMALAPCCEALWSIMWVFATAAAGGVLMVAVALFTPQDRLLPLDLGTARGMAAGWCAVIAVLSSVGSMLAGRLAANEKA